MRSNPTQRQLEIAREWQTLCERNGIPAPLIYYMDPDISDEYSVRFEWLVNGVDVSLDADYEKYNGMYFHVLDHVRDHCDGETLIYPDDVQKTVDLIKIWLTT